MSQKVRKDDGIKLLTKLWPKFSQSEDQVICPGLRISEFQIKKGWGKKPILGFDILDFISFTKLVNFHTLKIT